MLIGSRVTLSSGFCGSSVVASAGLVGAAEPAVVVGAAGAGMNLGVEAGARGAVVVLGGAVVDGAVVVGVLGVADVVVGGAVDVVVVGVVVSGACVGSGVSCERWVNSSATATTIARKPTLITLATTRRVPVGPSFGVVGSVISGW